MSLGLNIRRNRERMGWDQSQLGKRLDRTHGAVSQWESGRAVPRMPVIHKMADLFGISVAELMGEAPPQTIEPVSSSSMVQLLGYSHMGAAVDEETCERMVEVPSSVVEAHPGGYCIHATGSCMDNRYAHDAILYVDPNMMPRNGDAVLAEVEGYQSVVRSYLRGSSTTMLTADSHSGEFPDIVAGPEDPPVVLKGVIVWYQAEKDVRR